MRQLGECQSLASEAGIVVTPTDDLHVIEASIAGPADTPFQGGVFHIRLALPDDYPAAPPKGWFLTKIFHPNVGPDGAICVNTLKRDWDPATCSLRHVLSVIRCLLIEPNPDSALNDEAGKLLIDDFAEFARRARVFTQVHAMPKNGLGATPVTPESANTMQNSEAAAAAAAASNGSSGCVLGVDGAAQGEKQADSAANASKAKAAADKRRQMLKRL